MKITRSEVLSPGSEVSTPGSKILRTRLLILMPILETPKESRSYDLFFLRMKMVSHNKVISISEILVLIPESSAV
jgi:hypothetical protein